MPAASTPLRVCYFGSYRAGYARNQMMIAGLRHVGVEVIECHAPLWAGIADRVEQASGGWRSPRFWRRVASVYWRLFRLHNQTPQYDVMMLGYPGQFDAFLGRLLSWRRGKPMVIDHYMSLYLIATERGLTEKHRFTSAIIRWLEKIGLSLADLIISDTKAYRDYHCQTYGIVPDKFRLVPAGADDRLFYPRPEAQSPTPPFRVAYHGTFLKSHGLETMVRAAALLQDESDILFDFWGEGAELPAVKRLAQSLGVTNAVFHGWVDRADLPAKLAKAHLCLGVFGSTFQSKHTIQNKIWEGLMLGLPVITGQAATIEERLTNGEHLYLVERENPQALAAGILALKNDPALRHKLSQQGLERAQEHGIAGIGGYTATILRPFAPKKLV